MRSPRPLARIALAGLTALSLSACKRDADLPPAYRRLEVPEACLASADARRRGRELYLRHCALCHGERADGRGVRRNLSTDPRNFTDPAWRRRTSARRVYAVVREGVRGTAMPALRTLNEDATWDLVAYVLSVAEEGPAPQ